MKTKRILVGVCAGIAAYRACEVINSLRRDKLDTVVCMSRHAHHFVSALTLQTLSGSRVFRDMFEPQQDWDPAHISLASGTDAILIIPATSDIISKTACGICDDLLACTIAASDKPVVFAPAMNNTMYKNKILQANIAKLKKLGYHFIGPVKGHLACGSNGIGHIADTKDIVKAVKALVK